MRLGISMPERHISKPVLDAALEATTRLDESMLLAGAPLFQDVAHKIQWRPEPPGQEEFDHLGHVLRRGAGDCDDLAPYHAASLRVSGRDPDAQAEVYKSGPGRWHAVVRRGDGSIDDPSKWCGMRRGLAPFVAGVSGVGAVIVSGVSIGGVGSFIADPRLMVRQRKDGWEARADLPYDFVPWRRPAPGISPREVAMTTLHTAALPSQAIAGAVLGAARLARRCAPKDDYCALYLMAQHNVHAHDWDYDDVADEFGEDIADAVEQSVGAIWDKVVDTVVDKGGKILRGKATKFIAPVLPGGAPALMWAHGGLSAAESARGGGNVMDIARGGFGGAGRGALTYFEHPLVEKVSKEIPVVKDMVPIAMKAAQLAAQADVPTMARDAGVPAATPTKKVPKNKGKGSGSNAVFLRPKKVMVYL